MKATKIAMTPYSQRSSAAQFRSQANAWPLKAERGVVALHQLKRDAAAWRRLVQKVDRLVRQMPLWKLQIVPRNKLRFANRF